MKENKENFVSALVVGEVCFVVTSKLTAATKELRIASILLAEILKIKTKHPHFEFSFADSEIVKQPLL